MPGSLPESKREATGPLGGLPGDARQHDEGVSEVIGQILIFGILSAVLIMSLLTFGVAKEGAEDRVAQVQGESTVQRVATTVVQVALFAEAAPGDDLAVRSIIDLPDSLEGRSYQLKLSGNDIELTSGSMSLKAALFQSSAPNNVVVCDQSTLIRGGTVAVVVTTKDLAASPAVPAPTDCSNATGSEPDGTHFITLESA